MIFEILNPLPNLPPEGKESEAILSPPAGGGNKKGGKINILSIVTCSYLMLYHYLIFLLVITGTHKFF